MTMKQRMLGDKEKDFPKVRGASQGLPLKLGCAKAYVQWKLDVMRLKGFIKSETSKLRKGKLGALLKKATKFGLAC